MTLWERSLGYVYAAACIWDGVRKSVRPITADMLRTLADRVHCPGADGPIDPFGNPCVAGRCEFCGGWMPTHCKECDNEIRKPVNVRPKWETPHIVREWDRKQCPACMGDGGFGTACYRCGEVGRE